ncbi:MAG: type I 3-dehydroquinate dehydratase, partial [Phycisphaerae bacterium]
MAALPDNKTPIVVPVFLRPGGTAAALGQMQQAVAEGADWIELRCDEAESGDIEGVLKQFRNVTPIIMPSGAPAPLGMAPATVPVIVTLRSVAEGGRFAGTDDDLAGAIELAAQMGAAWVDVEFARWQRSAELRRRVLAVCQQPERGSGPGIILSAHDFSGRPADLRERIAVMAQERAASIIKIAWKAGSVSDAVEALGLIAETQRRYDMPLLPLAMGEFGQISRLLAAKFRAPFTFATLWNDPGSAPGQPTVQDLLTTYRWRAQRPGTAVCGVIGWPVGHSLSPAIHNAGFAAAGFDGVYVPLPIEPSYEAFAAAVDALRQCPEMNLRGLSVTIPHKENALRYVRERGGWVDPLSAHIGAVNTIVFGEETSLGHGLQGWNSDYAGALDALLAALGKAAGPQALAGMRVAVLGAGGAAR